MVTSTTMRFGIPTGGIIVQIKTDRRSPYVRYDDHDYPYFVHPDGDVVSVYLDSCGRSSPFVDDYDDLAYCVDSDGDVDYGSRYVPWDSCGLYVISTENSRAN